MARVRSRITDDLKAAFGQVCEHMSVQESTVIRGHVRDVVENHSDAVDDDTLFKAKSDYVKEDNKAYQQALHIPNNFHEELQVQLREKRYPLHPEEVAERWYKPYHEIIELGLEGDCEQRKLSQITHALNQYCVLHYAVDTPGISQVDAAVDFAGVILVEEGSEEARAFIGDLVAANMLPDRQRDEAFDALNDLSKKRWRESWNEAIGREFWNDNEELVDHSPERFDGIGAE